MTWAPSPTLLLALQWLIGGVWIFHGLYSKLLNGIPRHRQIIERILGARMAPIATITIGLGEIALGAWAISAWQPLWCAAILTAVLVAMNILEVARATDLLISAVGMLILNAAFIALTWYWALAAHRG